MERGLGEVDRARAIYVHASSMADPRRDPGFWADWNAFEVGATSLCGPGHGLIQRTVCWWPGDGFLVLVTLQVAAQRAGLPWRRAVLLGTSLWGQ